MRKHRAVQNNDLAKFCLLSLNEDIFASNAMQKGTFNKRAYARTSLMLASRPSLAYARRSWYIGNNLFEISVQNFCIEIPSQVAVRIKINGGVVV